MGINGLLPFLDKSSRRANVKEFSGQTVAVDAYCWLHKGAFSCADKLILNEPTFVYINYCMKFINMLLSHKIKPILVFDGRYLPAKAEIEKKRRESRSFNRKKGAELLKAGQVDQGRSFLRRSVDITHKMALNLIKQCREKNVDCIVAPYEADAQLAYMNIMNIAQLVITEDSDLLLFGCIKVLFKMDINGNGILIEKDKLHLSMGVRHDSFSIDKFRYMCILSGCDYLPSLPGIGLYKARKFINRTSEENMYEALLKLPVNLQMWTLAVTDEYRTAFIEADRTFRYQLVYDPIKRRQVPLNGTDDSDLVGEKLNEDVAFQLALGNIDPMTMEKLDDYNPDKQKSSLNNKKNLAQTHSSIWSNNFVPTGIKRGSTTFPVHNSTKGLSIVAGVSLPPVKRTIENDSGSDQLTGEFLNNLYGNGGKSKCEKVRAAMDKNLSPDPSSPKKSPILLRRKNPFAVESPLNNSVKKKRLIDNNRMEKIVDTGNLLRSRYFKQEEEVSHGASNNFSVLDIIDEHENSLNTSKTDEFQKEFGNIEENDSCTFTSFSKCNSKVKESCADIQTVISESSFIIKESGINSTDRGPENYETPKENSYIPSDDENSVNRYPKIIEASVGGDSGIKPKLVLSQVNDNPGTNKKFYYSWKFEDSDKGHTSPYFQKFHSVNTLKVLDSESSIESSTNVSLIRSTKKSVLRSGLSKSSKKTQSLLTRFGFQPRPKIQSEKM